MSDKLRTALQALDRELDRLQRNATQQATRHQQAMEEAAKNVAPASSDKGPETDPQVELKLVAMRDRVDSSIDRLETLLKESAGGAG